MSCAKNWMRAHWAVYQINKILFYNRAGDRLEHYDIQYMECLLSTKSLFCSNIVIFACFVFSDFSLLNEHFLCHDLFTEMAFSSEAARQFTDSTKSFSVLLSAVYLILVFTGQRWMQSRPRFNLRIPLFLWSFVLALFSIAGAVHTLPELYNGLVDNGWTYTLCDTSFYHGSTGFWAFVFTMSKAYELGDTLFIVLRRQPLIFLHYYHHVTVMMYSFYSYAEHVSSARWYIVMNYCIHSIMYTHYALRAVQIRVPSLVSMSVTSLQILQMVVGLIVTLDVLRTKLSGVECHQSYSNAFAAIIMFGSYLVLFGHFFYQRYASAAGKKPSVSNNNKVQDLSAEEVKKLHWWWKFANCYTYSASFSFIFITISMALSTVSINQTNNF